MSQDVIHQVVVPTEGEDSPDEVTDFVTQLEAQSYLQSVLNSADNRGDLIDALAYYRYAVTSRSTGDVTFINHFEEREEPEEELVNA